jgi:hypothetical protein
MQCNAVVLKCESELCGEGEVLGFLYSLRGVGVERSENARRKAQARLEHEVDGIGGSWIEQALCTNTHA